MKNITTVINWILQSGLLVWLFYFALAVAKPWVDSKIKHAKTAQQKEAWSLLEQVAMTTVNSLVSANLKGNQKFDNATNQTLAFLENHGIHVDKRTVQSAVQAAYEKSPLTDSTQKPDPVLEAIKTAPNRANDLSKEGDK
jgi:hypothetical protein